MIKKYNYIYEIRTNNLCYGGLLLDTCKTYRQALSKLYDYENRYGACDIYKKRQYI